MGFWNFIGEFALFNWICDLFSGKSKKTCGQHQQHFYDYDYSRDELDDIKYDRDLYEDHDLYGSHDLYEDHDLYDDDPDDW